MKISQLIFRKVDNPSNPNKKIEVVEYREFSSKNRPGSRHQLNIQNKVTTHYVRADLGERCFVHLLKLYLKNLSKVAHEKDSFFFGKIDEPGLYEGARLPVEHPCCQQMVGT